MAQFFSGYPLIVCAICSGALIVYDAFIANHPNEEELTYDLMRVEWIAAPVAGFVALVNVVVAVDRLLALESSLGAIVYLAAVFSTTSASMYFFISVLRVAPWIDQDDLDRYEANSASWRLPTGVAALASGLALLLFRFVIPPF
ncbi:MAG: hypothetical protein GF419_13080 [Ignavibacteriales bacterium]|jgi:hypothetical protein|nr:hypothetical protein [Ignavibacteriales bacterium]